MDIDRSFHTTPIKDDACSVISGGSFLNPLNEIVNCKHTSTKDIYCKTHHMMTCRTCLVKQHGLCDANYITYVAKEYDHDAVEKLVKVIDAIKEQIKDAVKEIKNENSLMYKEKEKAIQTIKAFRSEMSKQLDAFEKKALQSLDLTFIGYQKNTEAKLKNAEQCLTSHSESLKTMTVTADNEQSFKLISEFRETQKTIQVTTEALHKLKIQLAEIEFIPDSKLLELTSETTALGLCRLNLKRNPAVLYEVAEKRELRLVSDKSSNDCNITGIDRLPYGHILLADRSNKKLVGLDIASNRVKDHIKFQSEPWAVCVIHATEAAVSFPEEQKNVKFISIDKKMKISRALKLRHTCRALAFNGEELYISDQGVFVHVYTLDGIHLRKFSKEGNVKTRLSDFQSIAVKNNLTVLADWNEGLLAFDQDGKLVWRYNDHDLKRAGGICFDETGNILACASQSVNLIQLNREGKKIGVIANSSNGLVYPTTLCFNEQSSLIIVAQQEADVVSFRLR